jgi:hypothetical protein
MNYKCYSCAAKVKKAKSGGLANTGKGLAQFAIGNIPFFGEPIKEALNLGNDDFVAKNKFARGLQNFNNDVLNPAKNALAKTALNVVLPGAGEVAGALGQGLTGIQNKKNSSKSLGLINPRYAQTGGKIKKVPGGKLESLSSTGLLATGRKHEKGGIKLDDKVEIEHNEGVHKIDNDVVVSSDSLRDNEDGLSFAEKMTELERKKGKLEMQLKEELAKTGDKTNNTILLLKKKIGEITAQIGLVYGKQELTAMQGGLRDAKGNPNQLSQDIVPGPQNAMYGGEVYKVGGVIKKRQMGGAGTLFGNLFKGAGTEATTEATTSTFGSIMKDTNFSKIKFKEEEEKEEKPIMGVPQQPVNININTTQQPVESVPSFYDNAISKYQSKLNMQNGGRANTLAGDLVSKILMERNKNKYPETVEDEISKIDLEEPILPNEEYIETPNQDVENIVEEQQEEIEMKSGGWIEKARELIKRRGTEGKCTGSNFGGPDCPPGSRQYNLAVTFKNMAKRKMGGKVDALMGELITKVSINKLKTGGKIYDQDGYLNSNASNFTPVKKIRGKGGYTNITTKDMAFPIMVNGGILFPNTGDYVFEGNVVTERPIKAGMGLTISGNVNTTASTIAPSNPILPGNNYNNPQVVNQVTQTVPQQISSRKPKSINYDQYDQVTKELIPKELPRALTSTYKPFNDEKINGIVDATNKVQNRMALRNMSIKAGEMATTVAPGLVEGMFQMTQASKDLQKKYPTTKRYGEELSRLRDNMINAVPNAAEQTGDNLNASMSTTLRALTDAGENASVTVPGIVSKVVEQGNTLIATTLANTNQQLFQFNDITRKMEDAKAQEDHQTYNQLLQNKQELQNNLKTAIGKSIENLNNYGATYGPEGQKAADDLVLKLISKMPYFQQNEELMTLLQTTNPNAYAQLVNKKTTETQSPPPVSDDPNKKKYGGSIFNYSNNIRIKK